MPPGGRVPFDGPLPILFRASGAEPGAKLARRDADGVVTFSVDLVATVVFLLTRWEETVIPTRDAHGRMPANAGVAARQGFLDRPLADQYALVLREWLRALLPGWTPAETPFRVRLSHDIDEVRPFPDLRSAAGMALRSLRDGDATRAGRALAQTARQLAVPRSTDHARGIERIASLSRRHGMESAFYVMAAERGPHDSGYDPASGWVRDRLNELRGEGFELGFHPGYRTFGNFSRLSEEKGRVERVLGGGAFGGRQHFLRFRVPDTWRDWERLGLAYDSTLAFADHEGFRCGTCHPYRPFDLEQNREMRLSEIPLIVMDGTLRQYRGFTPEQGEERVRELATRCREVGGIFTLLWHNSSFHGAWDGWEPAYERMVAGLAAMQGTPGPDGAREIRN
jgi:hypothetical protein